MSEQKESRHENGDQQIEIEQGREKENDKVIAATHSLTHSSILNLTGQNCTLAVRVLVLLVQ